MLFRRPIWTAAKSIEHAKFDPQALPRMLWAPPVENNTDAYVAHVCQRLGVAPDHPLDFDGNPQVYLHLARAIAYHENGSAADNISLETWKEGAELAGLKVSV